MAATRSALTAVVSRYRARGAVREVGKALGLPEDVTRLASGRLILGLVRGRRRRDAKPRTRNLNLEDRRLKLTLELARAADRHAAPSFAASGRLRADVGSAR